jgi:DNA (cytosine-5)-methyltransferase 1
MSALAYYNEIDPYAAQWLRNLIAAGLIPAGDVDTRSIEDVRPDDLRGYVQCHFFAGIGGWPLALALAGWPSDRPVWTGSCPCQPFSQAGKGDGFADQRHLWPAWYHLIRECAPARVFGEQVEGPAARAWLDLVHDDMEAAGYAFAAGVLPAASVGAPQLRHRTWFVADADHAGWKRAERQGQSGAAREEWPAARSESLRSDSGRWPPGPRAVDLIPLRTDGISNALGGCKAYGNAIVPEVAAQFILAYADARGLIFAAGAEVVAA